MLILLAASAMLAAMAKAASDSAQTADTAYADMETVRGLEDLRRQIDELIRSKEIQRTASYAADEIQTAWTEAHSSEFNEIISTLDQRTRAKILETKDSQFAANVLNTIAVREAKRVVDESVFTAVSAGAAKAETVARQETAAPGQQPTDGTLSGIPLEFRRKMEYAALAGSEQEKMMLAQQIREYAELKEKREQPKIAAKAASGEIDPAEVIRLLGEQKNVGEILQALET